MDAIRSSLSLRRDGRLSLSLRRLSLSLRRDYQFLDATQDNSQTAATIEMSSVTGMENQSPSTGNGEDSPRRPTSFTTQLNALFRKNLTYQKRNLQANVALVFFPILLCLLLLSIQRVVDITIAAPEKKRECQTCIDTKGEDSCDYECTPKYFDMIFSPSGVSSCPEPSPTRWPALVQIPKARFRATRSSSGSNDFSDLPGESCREKNSCPVTILFTGANRSLAESLGQNLLGNKIFSGYSDNLDPLNISSEFIIGTDTDIPSTYFFEPALMMLGPPLYIIQQECNPKFSFPIAIKMDGLQLTQELKCVQGLQLWRNSSSVITEEILEGYLNGNPDRNINEILAAYDFLNTNETILNVTVWYNGTYRDNGLLLRILRTSNAAANSYLRFLKGDNVKLLLEFVKEMPKGETSPFRLNLSSCFGPLFFTWVILLLFPVILTNLVYEKHKNIRIFMKMHGLGDGPYWIISYTYFLLLSSLYMLCFVIFGSLIGLKPFKLNDYSVQFGFYFIYINLQIAFAFLASAFFSNVKTATVSGYLYVFGSGLLGSTLFQNILQSTSYPKELRRFMEVIPGFSLYRGLYDLAEYSSQVDEFGIPKMGWKEVQANKNGLQAVLVMMIAEWPVLLLVAYYLDQVLPHGSGIKKHPLWFLPFFRKERKTNVQQWQEYDILLNLEKPDISQEREAVQISLQGSHTNHVVICDNLKKVYPRRNGNPEKYAVRGLSLALSQGECFGLLGPNGAGKTSFMNMMTGLATPTFGTAFVQGLNIMADMDKVYSSMGVCPQNDLLWDTLTGREHLLFYGRLKNLKGDELTKAVEELLKKANLFDKGVADKFSAQYSGGMKRRLSVAISLIGSPHVVYMDEPSTGLDPASRKNLWTILQDAKRDKAIILTTHSMEEAESLCDRVGIFVNGSLQCLGSPKELKSRYGGFYVLTMTTPSDQEDEVGQLAHRLSSRATKVYHLAGTQKFHLPKQETRISDVFSAVENAKKKLTVYAWGLTDTTLEDVFIKVAKGATPII